MRTARVAPAAQLLRHTLEHRTKAAFPLVLKENYSKLDFLATARRVHVSTSASVFPSLSVCPPASLVLLDPPDV